MAWYFVGAAIITVLFAVNAVFVHVLRSRGVPRKPPPSSARLKQTVPRGQLGIVLLPVAILLASQVLRAVAPGSPFAQAMSSPWAVACLVPWAMAISAAVSVAATLLRRRRDAAPH